MSLTEVYQWKWKRRFYRNFSKLRRHIFIFLLLSKMNQVMFIKNFSVSQQNSFNLWHILSSQCRETASGMINYHGGGADILSRAFNA